MTSGCRTTQKVGANLIVASHGNYNQVITTVQRQELLLNIVRRRYLEPLQFTSLGTISQSRSVNKSAGGALNFGIGRNGGVNVNGGVGDFPTYSLTPQVGPESSVPIHEHLSLDVVPHLANAGYPLDLILTMVAREISGLRGIDVGSGAICKMGSEGYHSILCLVRELEGQDKISISNALWEEKLFEHPFAPEVFSPGQIAEVQAGAYSYTSTDDGQSFYVTGRTSQPVLWIDSSIRGHGVGRELIDLLNLDEDPRKKGWALRNPKFVQGVEFSDLPGKKKDHLTVETRSIYGVINLLSAGVRVPPEDGAATCDKGKAFDSPLKFTVCYSKACPKCAFVAVPYRCGWFYIADNDLCSKNYFSALYDLYNIAGPERIDTGEESRITSPVLSF